MRNLPRGELVAFKVAKPRSVVLPPSASQARGELNPRFTNNYKVETERVDRERSESKIEENATNDDPTLLAEVSKQLVNHALEVERMEKGSDPVYVEVEEIKLPPRRPAARRSKRVYKRLAPSSLATTMDFVKHR